jgi:tetratricopeptide (TPR) repeat protein
LDGRNLAQLAFAESGIGNCYHLLCDFPKAGTHLRNGLEIAKRLGDDSRCSRILANLTVIETTLADYDTAIRLGRQSIEHAARNPNQPELVTAYTNLADAYLLTGETVQGRECLQKAREWVKSHDDWQMSVAVLCENASWAMTTANVGLALSALGEIERISGGRERFIIHAGLMAKLQVLRAVHECGLDVALQIAAEREQFFRNLVPYYHLDTIAARAWVEKLANGAYSEQTSEDLRAFVTLGALGKRALLQAQGFLT